ncbi:hypothetical protein MalM25_01730 [Planctomycetes bacterium MalM25]|nr:hypothetical protein MalM25_01730 [Planctomycetes bacterium MalM25]
MSRTISACAAVLLAAATSFAQSDPSNFDDVLNYPTVVLGNPINGPAPGATLPAFGGTTQFNFNAGSGSTNNTFSGWDNEVNVFAGATINNVTIDDGTTLNLVGGDLHDLSTSAPAPLHPSVVNLLSGNVTGDLNLSGQSIVAIHTGDDLAVSLTDTPTLGVHAGADLASLDAPGAPGVTITGGTIGPVTTANNPRFQISGGEFTGVVEVLNDSQFNISGGDFADLRVNILNDINVAGGSFEAVDLNAIGMRANISGGSFGDSPFVVRSRAEANITGGAFGNNFQIESNGTATISGGTFAADFDVDDNGTLNLVVTQVLIDGVDRTSEVALVNAAGQDFEIDRLAPPMLLEGLFTDGSPFAFAFQPEGPMLADEVSTLDPNSTIRLIVGPAQLDGDFNADGVVDAADYTVWRDHQGERGEASIGFNGDGLNGVDQADYQIWQSQYGAATPATSQAIPEPAAWVLVIGGTLGLRKRIV